MNLQFVAVLDEILASLDFFGERIGPSLNLCLLLLYSFLALVCLCFQLLLLREHSFDPSYAILLNFVLVERLEVFLSAAILRLVDLSQLLVVLLNLGGELLSGVSHFALLVALCF